MKHTLSYRFGHPNPQFFRENYKVLNGEWDFVFDFLDEGIDKEYNKNFPTDCLKINVPFPYQAKSSLIGQDKTHCDVVWYRKKIILDNNSSHYKLTFFGVDYITFVYVNGIKVATHEGAYDSFSVDIKPFVKQGENEIVLRCLDRMHVDQIRGKQRWRDETFECFYTETSGIFKDVLLENLNDTYIDYFSFKARGFNKTLTVKVNLNEYKPNLKSHIIISLHGKEIHSSLIPLKQKEQAFNIVFDSIEYWNVSSPILYDVKLTLISNNKEVDNVLSYFGFSDVKKESKKIYINNEDTYLKLILDQGYFENTITSPTEEQIIKDINLLKEYGFNGMRKHEKIESPLYYYYLDLLGFYVWQECPSGHSYSFDLAKQVKKQIVRQIDDHISHPSIIAYVIFNESWGIQGIERSKEIQQVTVDLYNIVKEKVDDRFVISNDGWEHTKSDLITFHNYASYKEDLKESIDEGMNQILSGNNGYCIKNGRKFYVDGFKVEDNPILITEFGGIAFSSSNENWGYGNKVKNKEEFLERFKSQLEYIKERSEIRGWCYTQTTDVEIEVNGLFYFDRTPKFDVSDIKPLIDQFK